MQLRRLEAARDIANMLATSGNRVMLDSQSLLLNGERPTSKLGFECVLILILVAGDDMSGLIQPKK